MKKHLFTILIVIMSICLTSCNNLSQYKDGLNKKTSTPKSDSSSHSSDEDRLFSDVDDISSIIAGLESGNNSEGDISSPTLVNSNDKNGDTSSGNKPPNTEKTVINYKNMKAVWISYMDFGKFRGNSKEDFCKNVKMMFTKCKEIGLNTVITQVRAFGDAFYESQFFPWSRYVTGTAGKASDYDPLLVIVEEAHKLNLSVQAWINPYRIMTDTEIKQVNLKYKIRQWYTGSDNDYMINISGRWWLKPGNSEVKSLITDGANEIMKNYNVDGLHIDDYFYGASIESYEDTKQQAQKNTSELVQGLYKVVKSVDKNKIFGV
ncbi:MAG: family 10 glycosylhydrolase, partial [Oscillospiraceae bacterium]